MSKSPDPEARVASSHRAPQTLKAEAAVPTGVAIQSRAHEYICPSILQGGHRCQRPRGGRGQLLKLLCCAASEWVLSSDVCFSFNFWGDNFSDGMHMSTLAAWKHVIFIGTQAFVLGNVVRISPWWQDIQQLCSFILMFWPPSCFSTRPVTFKAGQSFPL